MTSIPFRLYLMYSCVPSCREFSLNVILPVCTANLLVAFYLALIVFNTQTAMDFSVQTRIAETKKPHTFPLMSRMLLLLPYLGIHF